MIVKASVLPEICNFLMFIDDKHSQNMEIFREKYVDYKNMQEENFKVLKNEYLLHLYQLLPLINLSTRTLNIFNKCF